MRIIVTRSWIPWRDPDIMVDDSRYPDQIVIVGCHTKTVRTKFDEFKPTKRYIFRDKAKTPKN